MTHRAAIAPQQASERQTHIDSPVFQAGSTGSWSGYTVDFSTGDVTGSGAPAVTAAAPGSRTGRN